MATRVDLLAQPKPNLLRYPDRRSVYWLDRLPTTAHRFELTPRWSQLSEPKRFHPGLQESRRPPVWEVSAAALSARPSQRVCRLALPRPPAQGWEPQRPLLNVVVKTAVASPRICQLAQPKKKPQEESRMPAPTMPSGSSSSRIRQLARPKPDHPEYRTNRPATQPVTAAARNAVASERVQVLAQHRFHHDEVRGSDPYAISPAALTTSASPRVLELCVPLARKCRNQ
ncbi:sperm microtubule associated protein 2 [Denticeps clupeoides]|uniref:sperm microtubule associated protein 2 n=1 Tax=Denticeps clupeoides TaxID=299321 RepID=UPI0010A4DC5E|nr:testicular haploid expressed gene protein-like [Denticeps clupeoides]XP_028831075.1 testicular haploid expressed gene protein-like [Denticeps clupeoides]